MSAPTPSFLVIGCQRCGTTWIDAALRHHQSISLPPEKQSYYFDINYNKPASWYLPRFVHLEKDNTTIIGEVATGYCQIPAIPRMAKLLPEAKLIMVMRDPIERAYSYFQSRRAEQQWGSFQEALTQQPEIISRGCYLEQIEVLLEYYPREQLHLLLYDDLLSDDVHFYNSILRFLHIDSQLSNPMFGQAKNASFFPRLRRTMHMLKLKPVLKIVSSSLIGNYVRSRRRAASKPFYSDIHPQEKKHLQKYYYRKDADLGLFLNRNLSHWISQQPPEEETR